jgi:hypothetical protein
MASVSSPPIPAFLIEAMSMGFNSISAGDFAKFFSGI